MKVPAPPVMNTEKSSPLKIIVPLLIASVGIVVIAYLFMTDRMRSPFMLMLPVMMLSSVAMALSGSKGDIVAKRASYFRELDAESVTLSRNEDTVHTARGQDCASPDLCPRVSHGTVESEHNLECALVRPLEDYDIQALMRLQSFMEDFGTTLQEIRLDLSGVKIVGVYGPVAQQFTYALQAQLTFSNLASDGEAVQVHAYPTIAQCEEIVESGHLFYAAEYLWIYSHRSWVRLGVPELLKFPYFSPKNSAGGEDVVSQTLLDLPGGNLAAPIGVLPEPFILDIKESSKNGYGPHGVCIGATGSGKSELLRTVVLSFSYFHQPAELNFVLIDFKGGASFVGLESLPHISAIITNLSDERYLVQRMSDVLLGELHRRQELLHDAGVSKAQDYKGELPALFIIVDEFSELLTQYPEFAEIFATIGRLGRSLEVFLLLASQRLEEGKIRGLESHISYRIALKTFTAQESRSLLGTTDAYDSLHNPGDAIFKSSVTRPFLSAYAQQEIPCANSDPIQLAGGSAPHCKTIEEIILSKTFLGQARSLWLKPLEEVIPASRIVGGSKELTCRCVLVDLPFDQKQVVAELNLNSQHMAIVGQPGSGKTSAIRALVLSLVLSSPDLPIYIFDSGNKLKLLNDLPQVAAVVGEENLQRLFDAVVQEQRKCVLIIDGLNDIPEREIQLVSLAGQALNRGIHLIVTSLRWAMRPALKDMLTMRIELKMDPAESQDRKLQMQLPTVPGRAILPEKRIGQFAFVSSQDIAHGINIASERGDTSQVMPVLPKCLYPEDFPRFGISATQMQSSARRIALGIGGKRLGAVVWDSEQYPHLCIIGQSKSGRTTTLRRVVDELVGIRHESNINSVRIVLSDMKRQWRKHAFYIAPSQLKEKIALDCQRYRRLVDASENSDEETFYIIDDADQTDSVDPLVEFLPYSQELRIHLVFTRASHMYSRTSVTPLVQNSRDLTAWLIHSAPREDGPIAGVNFERLNPGRAHLVQEESQLVQICLPSE